MENKEEKLWSESWNFLMPAALFLASFFLRLTAFQQTPFATGWDSYFYLVQVKSWLEEGSMHSSDLSLVYPLMVFIQWLAQDYVLSFKITAALLAALFSLLVYIFSRKRSEDKHLPLVLTCFTLFSPHLTYFAAQYPKNLLGLDVFLLVLISLGSKWYYTLILVGLSFFGHRLTAVLSVIMAALFFLFQKGKKWMAPTFLIGSLVVTGAGIFLPGILSFADMERFSGFISPTPQFAPYSFVSGFGKDRLGYLWIGEIILTSVIHLAAVYFLVKRKFDPLFFGFMVLCCLLISPFFTWHTESFGFRFFMVYVLLTPLLIFYTVNIPKLPAVFLIGIFTGLSFFSFRSYQPGKQDPPYSQYEQLGLKILELPNKDSIELIIAHKSLAEFLTFQTRIDCMPWIPEYEIAKERLWRLATGIREKEIRYYLGEDFNKVKKLNAHYFLLPEVYWQMILSKIEEEGDFELLNDLKDWKNPSKRRPGYLLKNK